MALILDTGPLYAALDRDDRHHEDSKLLLDTQERLVLPEPVLVETCYFLEEHLGPEACSALLRDVAAGAYKVECLTTADYERAADLVDQYAGSNIGFVDAAVAAVVERLQESKLASIDHRHFSMIRFSHGVVELLPRVAADEASMKTVRKKAQTRNRRS